MNNLFNEKGDLSDNGKDIFEISLDKEIQILLNGAENENELRIIGSLLCKRVGDMVSNAVPSGAMLKILYVKPIAYAGNVKTIASWVT